MKWIKKEPKVNYKKSDDTITKLIKINGINDINKFLNPSKDALYSPYVLKNIDEATNKIMSVIKGGGLTGISVDPDF